MKSPFSVAPFEPNEVVTCCESFAGDDVKVTRGMRFRASHPVVKRAPWAFLPADNLTEEDMVRHVQQRHAAEAAAAAAKQPPAPVAPRPKLIPIEDRRLCVRRCAPQSKTHTGQPGDFSAGPGDILSRHSQVVRDNPSAFVAIKPEDLERADALQATADMSLGGRKVYRGQWVHRDDELAHVNCQHFAQPDYEPDDLTTGRSA